MKMLCHIQWNFAELYIKLKFECQQMELRKKSRLSEVPRPRTRNATCSLSYVNPSFHSLDLCVELGAPLESQENRKGLLGGEYFKKVEFGR